MPHLPNHDCTLLDIDHNYGCSVCEEYFDTHIGGSDSKKEAWIERRAEILTDDLRSRGIRQLA